MAIACEVPFKGRAQRIAAECPAALKGVPSRLAFETGGQAGSSPRKEGESDRYFSQLSAILTELGVAVEAPARGPREQAESAFGASVLPLR